MHNIDTHQTTAFFGILTLCIFTVLRLARNQLVRLYIRLPIEPGQSQLINEVHFGNEFTHIELLNVLIQERNR